VPQDFDEAARWYELAAEGGNPQAQVQLGLLYAQRDANGRPLDRARALVLLDNAARDGDTAAQSALGHLLSDDEDAAPDYASARMWIEQAAGAGDANAQAWMGDCCRLGLVGPADFPEAEAWYRLAAAQGHVGAIIILATAMENTPDLSAEGRSEMFGLWLAAASAGNAEAQYGVACCYLEGRGCETDAGSAARYLASAAEQGHAAAAYRLGLCLLNGEGVEKDVEAGVNWLQRAAADGDGHAREALDDLAANTV
jgi:TPR repeat protein